MSLERGQTFQTNFLLVFLGFGFFWFLKAGSNYSQKSA